MPVMKPLEPLATVPPTNPLQLTVTQLETCARCPQEYYLKYDLGVPAATLEWPARHHLAENVRGEIIHAAIARKTERPASDISIIAAEELVLRGFAPERAREEPLRTLLATAQQMVPTDHSALHVEYPFQLLLPNAVVPTIVAGTIDCLVQRANGWEILDYKTDTIRDRASLATYAEKYALQMTTYALAAAKADLSPLYQTTLYFLDIDRPMTIPITDTRLTEGEAALHRIIEQITTGDFTIPDDTTPPCAGCIYQRNNMCWIKNSIFQDAFASG